MAAIARAFSSFTAVISTDLDSLKTIALFFGAGLLVFLLAAATSGLKSRRFLAAATLPLLLFSENRGWRSK